MTPSRITELLDELLALPAEDRVLIAECLWASLDEPDRAGTVLDERAVVAEANRRHAELASGAVAGRSHDEVMESLRRAISE